MSKGTNPEIQFGSGTIFTLAETVCSTDQADDHYEGLCSILYNRMTPPQKAQLAQLVLRGPIWDGDVLSKQARDDMLTLKLASRACIKSEQGFTVANYRGCEVYYAGNPELLGTKHRRSG
jgi:hypothetical protein